MSQALQTLIAGGESQTMEFKTSFDKISIFSPGLFYGGISVADIQADNYRSSLRNKLVAEGFYLVKSIEKYGSGFIRIRHALKDYPEIGFEVKEFAGGVMVTFSKQVSAPVDHVGANVGAHVGAHVGANVGANDLLSYICLHPGLRAVELATAFQLHQRTIERRLKKLKDDQLIEFRGASKTGGYFGTKEK